MRFLLVVAAALAMAGCQIIYKLPTRQGNIIEQKQLDQLQVGMSREQVHFLMGTPVGSSAFRPERWDYVGYYRSPRGDVTQRVVSLYFQNEQLARMDGIKSDTNASALADPDMKTVLDAEKKAQNEAERGTSNNQPAAPSGVITPSTQPQ